MPWCVNCGHYGPTSDFRRLPQKHDMAILNYVCKDRVTCKRDTKKRDKNGPKAAA